jgi:hypothetical protein
MTLPNPTTNPTPNKDTSQDPNDLSFNVMPNSSGSRMYVAPASASTGGSGRGFGKWTYITIAVLAVLCLGAAAYYMLGNKDEDTQQQTASRLPRAWLTQYFNTDACADQNTCGEQADPDTDGLGNYDEFVAGTIPINPDTDSDGLADGDEINIYKTEPKLKYTDRREIVAQNNWLDGTQIKNNFDPLTPGLPLSDIRKRQIQEAITQFKLHEPSITTTKTITDQTSSQKTYTNSQYGFEFKYPSNSKIDDCGDKDIVYFDIDCKDPEMPAEPMAIDFSTKGNSSSSLITSYAGISKSDSNSKRSTRQIGSVEATEFSYKLSGETAATTIVIFYKSDRTYLVGGKNKTLIDQVLSTFKFTK